MYDIGDVIMALIEIIVLTCVLPLKDHTLASTTPRFPLTQNAIHVPRSTGLRKLAIPYSNLIKAKDLTK